jgi:hypothetical protein
LCAALLAAPALADDLVLASLPAGECMLRVEARTQEPHVLRVRALHPRFATCRIDLTALSAALAAALATDAARRSTTPYTSISLGRLVDYPWLSALLTRTAAVDRHWNARTGRPLHGDVNRYVAELLSRPAATEPLQPVLASSGYRIHGASVEKVLVATADRIPGLADGAVQGRLPFDAMLWLLLERP